MYSLTLTLQRDYWEYIHLDEMTSNASDGVVKLTENDVPGNVYALYIDIENHSRYVTVTSMVGVSRHEKIRNKIAFPGYLA